MAHHTGFFYICDPFVSCWLFCGDSLVDLNLITPNLCGLEVLIGNQIHVGSCAPHCLNGISFSSQDCAISHHVTIAELWLLVISLAYGIAFL